MTELERAILRTVAYFDLFNYPLTSWEVWKWLWGAGGKSASWQVGGLGKDEELYNFRTVEQTMQSSTLLREKLEHAAGFVFLKGRGAIVATRQERYRLALEKLDRARRFTRTLVRIPFVRAVFACNSLGFANAAAKSDIDFFIIVQRNHIWSARLLAAGWAKLRKLRPVPGNRADKFCLSFFLADDSLDISSLRLPEDPYLTMWLVTLVPLYDPANLQTALWQTNAWVQAALPNALPRALSQSKFASPSITARIFAPLVRSSAFEKMAERMQRRVLAPNLRVLANRDTRVVLNNHMLKFHDNDRRQEYSQAFASRLASLGV